MENKNKKLSLVAGPNGTSYLFPFIMITSLFLMWGFAHGLLDVLDKHFQTILQLTKAQSGFIQFSLYGGYLIMAVPAGIIMKKYGYKKGIVFGLLLFSLGAFLFYPAAKFGTFIPFLMALFVLACGLTCLETAANPYSIVLGPKESASRRINFSQSFNGLGWIFGPLIGGLLIFGQKTTTDHTKFDSLLTPYMVIGCVVLVAAFVFMFVNLPDIKEHNDEDTTYNPPMRLLLKHPFFIFAVVAQFLYVAAQTGVNSFFINYVTEVLPNVKVPIAKMMENLGYFGEVFTPKNSEQAASVILAIGGMGLFWLGRISGSYILKFINPGKLLTFYGLVNVLLLALVVSDLGNVSVIALFSSYFFMSIMFPTIFALGVSDLGALTKNGSSFLVMAVAGGAFCPPIMGLISDNYGTGIGFFIPLFCFAIISIFGYVSFKQGKTVAEVIVH